MICFVIPNKYPVTGQSFVSEYVSKLLRPDVVFRTSSNILKSCLDLFRASDGSYDLVYITLSRSYFGALRDYLILNVLRPKRIIAHLHGKGFINANRTLRTNLQRSTDVIVLTEESVNELLSSVDIERSNVHVVGNPVFDESLLRFVSARPKNIETVYYFSNLMESKGYLDFIRLAERFSSMYNFEVAGTNVENLPTQGKFTYHGRLDSEEKSKFLHRSQVHLFMSKYTEEFYPLSLIESICSGNFCIALRHNGLERVFVGCGVLWMNSVEEVEDLLSDRFLLQKLYKEHCTYFGLNYNVIWRRFSLDEFNKKVLKIFDDESFACPKK